MNSRPLPRVAPLERGNGIPLYLQIQRRLIEQIQSRTFKSSDPMPAVEEIAACFGVSPMTARQAVKSLCDMGLVYSRQGKGTFVSRAKVEKDFRQVLSFTDEMKMRGNAPGSRVLSLRRQMPGVEVRKALELRAGETVFRLHRVRYADGREMGIECSNLPARLCPDLLSVFEPGSSLYQTLIERYDIQLVTATETVEVGRATAKEARLLRIGRNSPVFLLTRTSFLEDGKPAEYVTSIYRGDRYKIVNRLARFKPSMVTQ